GVGLRRVEHDRRARLADRSDRDPVHPLVADVVADLEPEDVAVEGQGSVLVVVRQHRLEDGDVHAHDYRSDYAAFASRFLTGRVTRLATHGAMPFVASP